MNTTALILVCVAALVVGALIVGLVFVVRDTVRRKGDWGINPTPGQCPECGTPIPAVRVPRNLRQTLWGGWTCTGCQCELDKWGRPRESSRAQ